MVTCYSTDIDRIGEVAQHAPFTPSVVATAVVVGFGLCNGFGAFELSVYIEFHFLTIPRGCDMMPVAYPVGWQIDGQGMFHTRMQVELEFVSPFLHHTELGVALRDVGCSFVGATQFAWLDIETDGECLAGEFHIVAAIDFHPLVVSAQVQHSLLHLRMTHEVNRGVVGRIVFQRTDMLGETRADKVPDGSSHQSWMTADDSPVFVHATTCITCH